MNRRRVKAVILGLAVLLVAIQFVQLRRTNPPALQGRSLQAHFVVPPQAQSIFHRACYSCHSYQTVWPWYAHVAPVSWLVVDDVNDARRHINFDDWDVPGTVGNAHMMCKDVRSADMPPLDYRIMHPEARLTEGEINTICAWADSVGGPAQSSTTPSPQ